MQSSAYDIGSMSWKREFTHEDKSVQDSPLCYTMFSIPVVPLSLYHVIVIFRIMNLKEFKDDVLCNLLHVRNRVGFPS